MENYSVREVVEQAVQTEKLGSVFYKEMAGRFGKNEGMKGLFDTLALKEKKHEKIFSDLKERIGEEEPEGWEESAQYLRAIVESEFFLGKNKSLPSLEQVRTEREAVGFALGFEKETLLYYHTLRDVVKEKEIIDEIIREEKGHIRELSRLKINL
jgi:rubrerythrin